MKTPKITDSPFYKEGRYLFHRLFFFSLYSINFYRQSNQSSDNGSFCLSVDRTDEHGLITK